MHYSYLGQFTNSMDFRMHLYPVAKARMSTASSLAPTEARQAPIETTDYWQS